MPIVVLSQLMINQIAAGEVIERPASVVKELVENSLDAGALHVTIEIEEGGRELIKVIDDGQGIAPEELPLAVTPHATSKVTEPDDLALVGTLGFRGEALASIASISRFKITSKSVHHEEAAMLELSGEQQGEVKPAALAKGTQIEVRNLFFNTPARRKFMKAPTTEMGHISSLIKKIAMAHPHVSFMLSHNGKSSLKYKAVEAPAERWQEVIGKDLSPGSLAFEMSDGDLHVCGLACLPEFAKANRKFLYVYVNGRPVVDQTIIHAIREGYRGLMDPRRFPVVVLFITMPKDQLDVNVHPAKTEIRIFNSRPIHHLVHVAIKEALLAEDLTPNASLSEASSTLEKASRVENLQQQTTFFGKEDQSQTVNRGPATAARQVGMVEEREALDVAGQLNTSRFQAKEPEREPKRIAEDAAVALTDLLQVHDSFIITQDEQGILLIDQHALHERYNYYRFITRIRSHGELESQMLLTPIVIDLPAHQVDCFEQMKPLLKTIGINTREMGPGKIGIEQLPTLFISRKVDAGKFLRDLIDKAEEEQLSPNDEAALHEILDMMACKASIKAGDAISETEIARLLALREEMESPSNCPHGRPTTVRLQPGQIAERFN